MEDQELITDFLIESTENLGRLDQEMVELEKSPGDTTLLASVFRTFHTIKGACGFLGFGKLGEISHVAENILSQLRNGTRPLVPDLVTIILETVDTIKEELGAIEATGKESGKAHSGFLERLNQASAVEDKAAVVGEESRPSEEEELRPSEEEPAVDHQALTTTVATEPAAVESKGTPKSVSAADSSIRVDVGLLDKLMNLVGELVLARNQILQFNATQEDVTLNATSQRLNLITTQLQEGVMKTRMQPIGMVWNKLPRVVRDLASSCGKQVDLQMDGAETELDKSIIEAIKDPLTHIVRNCCDHGIEMPEDRVAAGKPALGTLSLRAFHEGGQVNIEIADDGAGIDPARIKEAAVRKGVVRPEYAERMSDREALHLIFLPGFSMAEQVTNISGRGVGMDVVKTNIEKIGGTVDVVSAVGKGATVKIKIPLTLAIIPGLVVTMGDHRSAPREREATRQGERFVIPQVSLQELIRLEGEARNQVENIHGTPVYRRRGHLLPVVYLDEVLQLQRESRSHDIVNIVVLQAEERQFGLVVDGISDTQEIVVKPLGKQLKGLTCYAGATIMGDGKVALILDVLGIGQRAGVVAASREQSRAEEDRHEQAEDKRQTLLLFRSGRFERVAVPLSLVARLEEIPQTRIEQAGARKVAQYRGEILPLISLASVLDPGAPDSSESADPAQVVVFHDGKRCIGLLVDQILDIVEEHITIRQPVDRIGLLGSTVIGGRVTDLLDLHAVIGTLGDQWFEGAAKQKGVTVLVAEPSAFARGLIRSYLEMAGHHVLEAGTEPEALARLEQQPADVVLAAMDLSPRGAGGLRERLCEQPRLAQTPVVGLVEQLKDLEDGKNRLDGLLCYRQKFDREAVLDAVEKAKEARGAAELVAAGDRK